MDTIYYLIDGENIDATLGVNILKRFPRGEERPRWDRVLRYNPWRDLQDAPADETDELALPNSASETAPQGTAAADPAALANAVAPADLAAQATASDSSSAPVNPATAEAHTGTTAENPETPAINPNQFSQTASTPTPSPALFAENHAAKQAENSATQSSLATQNSGITTATQSPACGLFFLNTSQRVAKSFVQALLAIGWQPILLTSKDPELKIVDIGIKKTIEAIVAQRPGAKVVIASHDVDYLPQIELLLDAGHEVAMLCFREYLSLSLAELEERGLKIVDLEYDVDAFTIPLSRVTTIDIAEYNPYEFI